MQKITNNAVAYKSLSVSSPAFEPNGFLPKSYSCQGGNFNPPLTIRSAPKEAKSIAAY